MEIILRIRRVNGPRIKGRCGECTWPGAMEFYDEDLREPVCKSCKDDLENAELALLLAGLCQPPLPAELGN